MDFLADPIAVPLLDSNGKMGKDILVTDTTHLS